MKHRAPEMSTASLVSSASGQWQRGQTTEELIIEISATCLAAHTHSTATSDVTDYSFKATAYVQYLTVSTKTTLKPYISETIKPVRHRNKV